MYRPLTDDEKADLKGAKLVGLQVVFRHGARINTSPLKTCFNLPNFTENYTCGLEESLHWRLHEKVHHRLKLKTVYPKETGRCGTGRLQDEAVGQFESFAKALRKAYNFDDIGITANTTFLRADELPRTQASMYLLVAKLFPEQREMEVHLMPRNIDAWSGHPDCPLMLKAEADYAAVENVPIFASAPEDNHFAQQYANVTLVTSFV